MKDHKRRVENGVIWKNEKREWEKKLSEIRVCESMSLNNRRENVENSKQTRFLLMVFCVRLSECWCLCYAKKCAGAAKFHIDGHCINLCKLIVDDFRTQYTTLSHRTKIYSAFSRADCRWISKCAAHAVPHWLSVANIHAFFTCTYFTMWTHKHKHKPTLTQHGLLLRCYGCEEASSSFSFLSQCFSSFFFLTSCSFILDTIGQQNNGNIRGPCENFERFYSITRLLNFMIIHISKVYKSKKIAENISRFLSLQIHNYHLMHLQQFCAPNFRSTKNVYGFWINFDYHW